MGSHVSTIHFLTVANTYLSLIHTYIKHVLLHVVAVDRRSDSITCECEIAMSAEISP